MGRFPADAGYVGSHCSVTNFAKVGTSFFASGAEGGRERAQKPSPTPRRHDAEYAQRWPDLKSAAKAVVGSSPLRVLADAQLNVDENSSARAFEWTVGAVDDVFAAMLP